MGQRGETRAGDMRVPPSPPAAPTWALLEHQPSITPSPGCSPASRSLCGHQAARAPAPCKCQQTRGQTDQQRGHDHMGIATHAAPHQLQHPERLHHLRPLHVQHVVLAGSKTPVRASPEINHLHPRMTSNDVGTVQLGTMQPWGNHPKATASRGFPPPVPTQPPVPSWHSGRRTPTLWCVQLLPGGFPSSIPPQAREPARLNGKLYLQPAKGERPERKEALSWKGWFTFLKKMPALRRAAGFWLRTELKGFENELRELGCWHFTEPGLGPGLQIQSSSSPARSCKLEIWG